MRANPPMAHANPFPSLSGAPSTPTPALLAPPRAYQPSMTSPGGNDREALPAQEVQEVDLEKEGPTPRPSKLRRVVDRMPPWKWVFGVDPKKNARPSRPSKLKRFVDRMPQWTLLLGIVVMIPLTIGLAFGILALKKKVDADPGRHGKLVGY